uniref:Uncharacterized protein n=1 Tax=Rhizophora mucronata TaxID=61149 RepID=A0A2P2IY71_RHIMU
MDKKSTKIIKKFHPQSVY